MHFSNHHYILIIRDSIFKGEKIITLYYNISIIIMAFIIDELIMLFKYYQFI